MSLRLLSRDGQLGEWMHILLMLMRFGTVKKACLLALCHEMLRHMVTSWFVMIDVTAE